MNQAVRDRLAAVVDRLLECVEDEISGQGRRGPPADNPPRKHVDDERDVDEATPGRDVREVRHPQLIRARRTEISTNQILRSIGRRRRLGRRRPRPAADRTREPQLAHQAAHAAPRHAQAFASHLSPDFAGAIHLPILVPDAKNDRSQHVIVLRPRRAPRGFPLFRFVLEVRRWGDRQHPADRLDPIQAPMIVDERDHHFARRSSAAWAKYADAFLRISFARRSSKLSFSSCFRRARSSVVRPGRWPVSRSAWRTHRRNTSTGPPIFSATDRIAPHCDGYSGACSKTIRTARSRNSGEYLLRRPMGPILPLNGPSDKAAPDHPLL